MDKFVVYFENDFYECHLTKIFKNNKEINLVQSFEFESNIEDNAARFTIVTCDRLGRKRTKVYGSGEFTISYDIKSRHDWNRILNR